LNVKKEGYYPLPLALSTGTMVMEKKGSSRAAVLETIDLTTANPQFPIDV